MRRLGRFLAAELAPAQGRGGYTLRLTLSCALVITCFMTLQIPFLAVALIVVFYVSQPNVVMMALVGVVFFLTISVTIGLVLLIFKYAYDYPLLRLIAATLLFSGALYLMRVLGKLGLAFFVVALALIYAQTFPSMTDQSEILVRLLLWLWAAINLAVLLTVLVNACFPDAYPARQFRSRLRALFRQAAGQLRGEPPMTAAALAARLPELQTLLKLGTLSSPQMCRDAGRWEALMVAAVRC
ncbi:TPA: FUSC family protein, partial [Pluralibacter gergoviae]|nr:FUSC family protein [Pluralibacter gergoviae]